MLAFVFELGSGIKKWFLILPKGIFFVKRLFRMMHVS